MTTDGRDLTRFAGAWAMSDSEGILFKESLRKGWKRWRTSEHLFKQLLL